MKNEHEDTQIETTGQRIGIVAGSGPDAGMDLWRKLLQIAKHGSGNSFRGDVDAPYVIICSNPALGLSMDMAKHKELVWSELSQVLAGISSFVDCVCIACYTLHVFEDRIHSLELSAEFVSLISVVVEYVLGRNLQSVGLLTAGAITTSLPPLLTALEGLCEVEIAANPAAVRQLIFDIKTGEPRDPEIIGKFEQVIRDMDSETVILGCTELSLVQTKVEGRGLVDGVALLAEELARRAGSTSQDAMTGYRTKT